MFLPTQHTVRESDSKLIIGEEAVRLQVQPYALTTTSRVGSAMLVSQP